MKVVRLGLLALVLAAGIATTQAQVSLLPTVVAERNKISGTPSEEQLADLLNRVAWQHRAEGWGLSRKEGGNRCVSPKVGSIACDILHHKPTNTLVDVFIGVGDPGGTIPTWSPLGPPASPDRVWVAPVDPGGVIEPPPPPSCGICEAAKVELQGVVIQQRDQLDVAVRERDRLRSESIGRAARIADLEAEIELLKTQPAGTCQMSGPGWVRSTFNIKCTVVR